MTSGIRKVVIVTGGGSGIGQATLVEFAKSGYNVVMTGRTRSKLETTADMCKAEGLTDSNVLVIAGDVSKPEDNARIIRDTLTMFDRIDVLVNNAGHYNPRQLDDGTLENLDKMYNVHVRGVFDMTQKAMPHLLKTKGSIVNVSSVAGMRPSRNVIYAMMKACQDHFTRAISVEYAPKGVRVNSVNPGFVKTSILDGVLPDDQIEADRERIAKCVPIGKYMEPRDIAMTIVFLASDDASFITGANVPVDGAYRNTMAVPK